MVYNLTNVTNSYGAYQLIYSINELTNYWLFVILLLVLWIVLIIGFKTFDTKTALLNASWITSIIGSLFYAAGLIAGYVLSIPIILTGFFVLAHVFSKE